MYMYHIQMSSHSSYVSIHIPYMSGYPAGVTPTESPRHNVAMRDPSLHDVVTAASAPWTVPKKVPPPGRMGHQIMKETMGKTRKTRFSAFGFWGSSQTKFWINPNTLVNGLFLKWRTPSFQLSSQILHFLWGNQRFWGTPRLQFKAPHNGSCNRRNLKHGSTWLQVL